MPHTDEQLLDFDGSRIQGYDPNKTPRQLAQHGETFRSHLVIARIIESWAESVEGDESYPKSRDYREGYGWALRDLSAHLRLGDFLQGGVFNGQGDGE